MKPLVSIITVNYKQPRVSLDFLRCCTKIKSDSKFEVILVDNEFDEENGPLFQLALPDLRYVPVKENVGFGAANNIAANLARGKYLLFLNNDIEFKSDFVDKMLTNAEQMESFGIISPRIYYHEQPQTLQYAGYTVVNSITGRNQVIKTTQHEGLQETAYGHGAAMMVIAEEYHRHGGFLDDYFLYYEELDLASRLAKAKLPSYVLHDAEVFHKESISTGKGSPLKNYYVTRNRILLMRKNFGDRHFLD